HFSLYISPILLYQLPLSTLFPYTTLFRSTSIIKTHKGKTIMLQHDVSSLRPYSRIHLISGTKGIAQKYPLPARISTHHRNWFTEDRKSTRLNSSHVKISYAVFCLKKKNNR